MTVKYNVNFDDLRVIVWECLWGLFWLGYQRWVDLLSVGDIIPGAQTLDFTEKQMGAEHQGSFTFASSLGMQCDQVLQAPIDVTSLPQGTWT